MESNELAEIEQTLTSKRAKYLRVTTWVAYNVESFT